MSINDEIFDFFFSEKQMKSVTIDNKKICRYFRDILYTECCVVNDILDDPKPFWVLG